MSLPDISKVFFMDPVARTILPPQLMLTTRSFKPLGLIKYTNWNFSLVANGMDEFTFDVYKPEDITEDMDPKKKLLLTYEKKVWDNLVDLKLILIQDYGRFEISVNYTDNTKTVKSVHAISLECELSQILLHDFHVNDDEAMATMEANEYNKEDFDYYGNFIPTTLCNFSDEKHSLIHRVLADKAPHWTVGNQKKGTGYFTPFVTFDEDEDCELSNEFQRTYTCNGESIYEFLTGTVANEANVVFVFDTINRVINCYSACDCITQHNKELRAAAIGEDTNVFLSKEKLVNEISITSKKDNVKNCFRVEGGDDYINAMVAVANVNGSNYITQFSEFQYDDMSEELKDILGKYEKAIKEAQPEYEKKYLQLCTALDDLYDKESGKMPSVSTEDETASDQASVISTKLKTFGTTASYNSDSHVGATNGIESLARIYVTSNYDIEIVNGSTSYTKNNNEEDNIDGTWKGTIKITNSTDEKDTTQISATVTVIDDDIRICEQKIEKALAKGDMVSFKFTMDKYLGDDYKITDSERDSIEKYLYDNYCLNRLISFYDAYETCVSTLIDMGKNKSDSAEYNFYLAYVTIRDAIGAAKKKRQSDVDEAKATVDRLSKECSDFQAQYDMETYLGRQCYLEYCAYRREDTYSNPNYISDGLTDSECIQRAKELLDVARKEIKKACVLQRTLEIDLNNLLMLEEFRSFWNKFSMFNYVRLETDDEILKLRLIGLDINGTSLSSVNVTFSDQIENVDGNIDDLQSIMEQAKDMSSSFPSTIRQVKKNEEASAYVGSLRKNGLIAAQTLISNADNNEVTYGGFGILCRNQGDSGDYGEKQLRVIGNGIYLTTDSWKTVEMCIGEINLCNDEGQCTEKYGIIADTIVTGTIIGGDSGTYWNLDTGVFHMSSSTTVEGTDKDGNTVIQGINEFIVDTTQGYIEANFSNEQNYTQLRADVDGLKIAVNGADGNSGLVVTVNEIKSEVFDENGNSKISQMADEIKSEVSAMRYSSVPATDGRFFIRYSKYSTGSEMTEYPMDNSAYIGILFTGETTPSTDYTRYTWSKINANTNGYPANNSAREYLHIKYSNDGKTFYSEKSIETIDVSNRLLTSSGNHKEHDTDGTKLEAAEKRIVSDPIYVTAGESYRIKASANYQNAFYIIHFSNGNAAQYTIPSSNVEEGEVFEGTITIPSNADYIRVACNLDVHPDKYSVTKIYSTGECPGIWTGTYVNTTQSDSTKFSDYLWELSSPETGLREVASMIRQQADRIELTVSDGDNLASRINLDSTSVQIKGNKIVLNGTVTANEYFKILTDGSAEASGLVVENEISTDTLNVNTINNGQYQKTLINTPVLHVKATPVEGSIGEASDDNSCYWNANFETLQGALNSIPKFMNGKTVFIRLHADVTENIVLPRISSGAIHIYLEGHAVYGYISGSSAGEVRIFGGNQDGSTLTEGEGKISPVTGTNYGGFITSVGCGINTTIYLENLSVYGDSTTSTNKTSVCSSLGGFIYVNNVKITNTQYGFVAHAGGRMHCRYTSGIAEVNGFVATGGFISLENTTQAGGKTKSHNEYSGGTIKYHKDSFEGGTSGGTPTTKPETNKPTTTTPVTKTVTYTAKKANSIRNYTESNAKWRTDNAAKVGQWDSSYGYHAAFWFFEDDFTNIKDKTISSVTITVTRNSGGNSGSTPHNFYAHGWESQPSSTSPSLTSKIGSKNASVGDTISITITDSNIINSIKSKKGICAIAADKTKSNYSVLSGTMKIKFTYTEKVTA